jgi:hypothetical protein
VTYAGCQANEARWHPQNAPEAKYAQIRPMTAARKVDMTDPQSGHRAAPPTSDVKSWSRRKVIARSILRAWPYLVASVISLGAALWTYRPWQLDGAIMVPSGDALAFHAWVQNIIESGWYETGNRLAAPFVQNNHPYTVTDEFLFAAIGRVLAPLTGSAGAAVMWWVVLSFPLAAIAAVGLARYLQVSPASSVVPGVAFALLPDHFIRGTGHFSLATSWVIPLGLFAAISLVHPPRFTGRCRVWFEVGVLTACVSVSLVNAYYAVFSGLFIAAAGIGALVATRAWRVVLVTAGRGLALVIPLAVAVWVDRANSPAHMGYEAFNITRSAADAEVYGGKISAMLLPSSAHRFLFLRDIRTGYDATFPNAAEGPALGLVAGIGFIALVCWAVLLHWRRSTVNDDLRIRTLAALTWVGLFAYVVGGLGTVWSLLLNGGGIRVWSRMHVFLALIALLAVGITIDRIGRHSVRIAVVALFTVIIVVDQTSPIYRPNTELAKALRAETTTMTKAISARVGAGAMIYQYPQVNFPVQNRVTAPASAYDGFLPYLYSSNLRWSYGGLEGDPAADWQLSLAAKPLADQVALLATAGFAGILVDHATLASTPELAVKLAHVLGKADYVSSTGRWDYYDLRADLGACGPAREAIVAELKDVAVRPPLLYPGSGITTNANGTENDGGPALLRIVTLRDAGWPKVSVTFTVDSPTSSLVVRWPDGTQRELTPGSTQLSWSGTTAGHETPIRIERADGIGSYHVRGLVASADLSPEASTCLTTLASKVSARS